MLLSYYADTDSLYIDFNSRPSADSREIQDGIVIDLDSEGRIVGIDIQLASETLDFASIEPHVPPIAVKNS